MLPSGLVSLKAYFLDRMSDMTSYADAIREVSASRKASEELKDYPSSLYGDLAAIYERAGKKEGSEGSVTAIPIFISPEDNKASPVFDAAKQLTDVQIVMSRKMHEKGYSPAIDVLSSKSKEMNGGEFASSLITYYARGKEAAARGEALDKDELLLEEFAEAFEKQYINQGVRENRSMEETHDIGNKLLAMLSAISCEFLSFLIICTFSTATTISSPSSVSNVM